MTDNPSGSTGQNVTTPANAPAGSDSSEREALARIILESTWMGEMGTESVFVRPSHAAERILAAGFTRRAQHDGERVARLTDRRRDTVECYVCFGNGATTFNNGHVAKCRACDGKGRLNVDAVRELVEDQYRAHKDTIAMVQANATEALANNEKIKAGYAALRAERDALAAKLAASERGYVSRSMTHDAFVTMMDAAEAYYASPSYHEHRKRIREVCEGYQAEKKRAAALAEALRNLRSECLNTKAHRESNGTIWIDHVVVRIDAALAGNGTGEGDGWIACSERMPDTAAADTGEFIVLLNGEDVTHGWLREGAWLVLDAECFDPVEMVPPMVLNSVVTHWRPLPAAPPSAGETNDAR